jgi:amino acid transporter
LRAGRAAGLGVTALAMIDVAAIASPRNLPMMAEYGWGAVFFLAVAIVAFLLPITLVLAELATAWPRGGGVYRWVAEAFRGRAGALAVWCDWAENLVWFPTVLSFTAVTVAYVVDPDLATSRVFLVAVMLVVFWGSTLLGLRGVRLTSLIGSVGTILGALLPGVLVIVLGAAWLVGGHRSEIPFSGGALVPDLGFTGLAFLGGVVLLFAGMEVAGFHIDEARDARRDFPRALFLAAGIIAVFSILGSLALAIVLPQHEISLVAGVMQAFQAAFDALGVGWLLRPTAALVAIGGVAHMIPWIMGPATGLAGVARAGEMPAPLGRVNRAGVPVRVLILQAAGGTVFSLLFLLVPSVSTSYWILSALTAQVIIVMYVLIFAAAIRLRHTRPEVPRPFRVPGGTAGMWAVGGIGIVGCLFAFVLGFAPPDQLKTGNPLVYVLGMMAALVALSLPPFLVRRRRPPARERADVGLVGG